MVADGASAVFMLAGAVLCLVAGIWCLAPVIY